MSDLGFTEEELRALLTQVDTMDLAEVAELETMLGDLQVRAQRERAKTDLLSFCLYMDPTYKVGKHHRVLAERLMALESGEKDRACVNMPPRHGKSQLSSIYFPAWYIGRNPKKQVMMVSHTADLAVDFGRKVRNLIDDAKFQEIFPDISLASDSKSAGRWSTNHGGAYYATGVGSSLAGRGADMLIIDDPHSEQDVLAGNYDVFDKAYQWFTYGARTRLMPRGAVAIIATRWHMADLTGRVVQDMVKNEGADQYEVVEFPAILEIQRPDGSIRERALWPEFFNLEALHRTRASMPTFQWNAQYQQNPTAEGAALVKREWWRIWVEEEPPEVDYIIMSMDTAAEAKERRDYTALTVWGVFYHEAEGTHCIILLNAIRRRVEFPELKVLAVEEYNRWKPDAFIVEKKSSGVALFQELRRTGVLIQEYTPHRGSGNKYARLQSVADIISSGIVWVPTTRWAEELVEEIAGFPVAQHDDLCFVAGTRVRMANGSELPIEEVRAGDAVMTPAGVRRVLAAGYTGLRQTFTLKAGGTSLVGTGNHPIATTSGWKRLDTMTVEDTVKLAPGEERRARVEHISAGSEKAPVYNLSVEGAHCFYANGVLVHNCDSTVMALMRFRQGGFIRLPTDDEEEREEYVPRRAAYY